MKEVRNRNFNVGLCVYVILFKKQLLKKYIFWGDLQLLLLWKIILIKKELCVCVPLRNTSEYWFRTT